MLPLYCASYLLLQLRISECQTVVNQPAVAHCYLAAHTRTQR